MTDTDPFFKNLPPPGWGNDDLSNFMETAQRNAWATYTNLRVETQHLCKVNQAFKEAGEHLTNSPAWFAGFFLLKTHSHYLSAVRLAMSGQIAETYMVLRGCVESALYGFYLYKHPNSQYTWLSRHNDAQSTQRVKDEFKVRTLLDTLQAADKKLADVAERLYEQTIDYGAHPNERALSSNLNRTDGKDCVQFNYNYLNADELPLKLALKTCLRVGVCCLQVFGLVFHERFQLLSLDQRVTQLSQGL